MSVSLGLDSVAPPSAFKLNTHHSFSTTALPSRWDTHYFQLLGVRVCSLLRGFPLENVRAVSVGSEWGQLSKGLQRFEEEWSLQDKVTHLLETIPPSCSPSSSFIPLVFPPLHSLSLLTADWNGSISQKVCYDLIHGFKKRFQCHFSLDYGCLTITALANISHFEAIFCFSY